MTDILVNFNTTIEISEKTIYDRRIIAVVYLKGRFTIDFLSALPLDLIAGIFIPEGNTKQKSSNMQKNDQKGMGKAC